MPTYDFRNKETGEVIEKIMKIAAREKFLADNPHLEQIITKCPALGDPIRLGIKKPPSDFQKNIIGRVAAMPGSDISAAKFQIPREF